MNAHYPRARYLAWTGGWILRESLCITFFMRRPHEDVAQAVMNALRLYLGAVGSPVLGWYGEDDGDWGKLDSSGWEVVRRQLLAKDWPGSRSVDLRERVDGAPAYQFEYQGRTLDPFSPGAVSAASFWLPTEYLEERGPEQVRQLALDLGMHLPFCSGQAGLAFNRLGTPSMLEHLLAQHPGIDDGRTMDASGNIGTRVRAPSWMNFLGPPVLGELGGPSGLRSRLSSADISVQELPGERAVITLGPWPEAGDTEQGHTLPLYRELARVLEPWLYQQPPLRDPEAARATRRWERRFLD